MEPCWRLLVSYLPKWLIPYGNPVSNIKQDKETLRPPDVQQLFQAADKETDRTVTLTGPKNYQVVRQ